MSAISDQLVATSKPFLGPVAEMFLNKQSKNYMKTELGMLAKNQLKEFAQHIQKEALKVMSPEKAGELANKIASI